MQMTPAEYYATHPDYRSHLADGTPSVLRLDPETGATVLEPVRFTEDATRCVECGAEAPRDPDGRCDFCGIESSEAEHEANNAQLTTATPSEPQ